MRRAVSPGSRGYRGLLCNTLNARSHLKYLPMLDECRPLLQYQRCQTNASPPGFVEQPPDGEPSETAEAASPWMSRRTAKLLATVAVGATIWFMPHTSAITEPGWHLLSIFVATIVGIVLQPLPTGAVAALAATAAMLTQTLTFNQAFKAFSSEVPWLIAVAMFLADGVTATGLGKRIAYTCVNVMGSKPLGLAYGLVFAEALLSPAIPSVAARSGGIILPLAKGMCQASGSSPEDGTERRLGSFLMFTCFQTAAVTSGMFLTANHPNPLSAKFAEAATDQVITWALWAKAAAVPGLVSLLTIPLVTYFLYPPTLTDSSSAQTVARQQLQQMGRLSRGEVTVLGAMTVTVTLWVLGHSLHVSTVAAALTGLSILLVTDVLKWEDCVKKGHAWDTMWWFAIVIALATQLRQMGVIDVFSHEVAAAVGNLGLPWQPSFALLLLIYYYSHYFFASNVAHVSAMYSAFLAVMVASGTPPLLAALVLAYFSNMMGAISTWGMSHGPMFYGEGYVPQSTWLSLSLVISFINIGIWLTVGAAWWHVLGLW